MTGIEIALTAIYAIVGIVAYSLGKASAHADAELDRMREQRRRDHLAREIEEGIAAFNSRPQLHGVAEVLPFTRRENRDSVA